MLKYILRRILIFIPTLFAISLIAFVISINAPGDPVETLVTGAKDSNQGSSVLSDAREKEKNKIRHKLGLDLPVFYFTITTLSSPDTLYRIQDRSRSAAIERLINQYGNWPRISDWYLKLEDAQRSLLLTKPDSIACATISTDTANQRLDLVRQEVMALLITYDSVVIENKLKRLSEISASTKSLGQHDFLSPIRSKTEGLTVSFAQMKSETSTWKNWVPSIHFYGYNQYHRWIFGDGNWLTGKNAKYCRGIIRGDFGISYATELEVTSTIKRAIPWSLLFTILSVILAYIVSIPIGVHAAANRGGFFDRSSSVMLFMLYSLPTFFMGTLLLMSFANPDAFNIFEANGVKPVTGYPPDAGLLEKFRLSLPYIVLPLVTYTYSSLAFLSRTMRVAMLEVVGQDFIRTAKAKGLPGYLVMYKHGLRNALLPIITVFSNIFPAAVGGSVILEFIFGIPGMGQEILTAISTKDYTMIIAVFTLSGFMTLIGYLVADILYAVVDPRISYSRK